MAINAASQQFAKATFKALAHGAFQGGMTAINGGNFWNGFAAGALSSIAASAWSGGTTTTEGFDQQNNWAYGTKTITHAGLGSGSGTIGAIAFGTVAGGAGAALTGGNFWQGAVTGLFVSSLNHGLHNGDEDPPTKVRTQASDKAEGWTNSQFRDLYEFNQVALDAYGYVRGAAELSALKWNSIKIAVKGLFMTGSKNVMLEGKLANHLFKGEGKLLDNETNRSLITKLSNGNSLGVDAYGKSWYAKTLGNGTQIYSYAQNGVIKGAGINITPVNIITRYGLK